jgi:hypothetical protein
MNIIKTSKEETKREKPNYHLSTCQEWGKRLKLSHPSLTLQRDFCNQSFFASLLYLVTATPIAGKECIMNPHSLLFLDPTLPHLIKFSFIKHLLTNQFINSFIIHSST